MPVAPSAGLLLYRTGASGLQVLLGHMGGPFWAGKDAAAWSIPKGEYGPDEDPLTAARREFAEELGAAPPPGEPVALGAVRQRTGKVVTVWAQAGDFDTANAVSNTFDMEWPPRSGRVQSFPEIDRAAWFDLDTARGRIVAGQVEFLDRLVVTVRG